MARTALLTYEDLERFPEDGLRRELIGGDLVVSPSPIPAHQSAVTALAGSLLSYARTRRGRAFVGPIDIVFGDRDVVAPDAVYVAADRLAIVGEKNLKGAPSLVIEVLSPSTTRVDRTKKRSLYARSGVLEYWIVDVKRRSIERCSGPTGQGYETIDTFGIADGAMPAATLAGLRVDLAEIFA